MSDLERMQEAACALLLSAEHALSEAAGYIRAIKQDEAASTADNLANEVYALGCTVGGIKMDEAAYQVLNKMTYKEMSNS